ncbi:methyl-accepting chemotaxis protein [Propionispora vibrioides]|uniref:Methyl-accepting chemotaxis protein (MCP) signalling domain-containing protein n=1 Tax=Propionispora vibrioides TaxID=112903 RepID=A0A1H8UN81_9FIRM|nr:methyl-accepting chemotaxis protein [Propionispora vibrioides]SEP04546.1 Methyl-accepting chemotaxis protein (MCP) signalling domain-containing protein [Propionispora vibrioides]
MTLLDSTIHSAEVTKKLMPLDCCIMITDPSGLIVKFVPAQTFDMGVREGDYAVRGGTVDECIRTKSSIHKSLPQELYGVPIKATCEPLFEDGKFIGAYAIGLSLETQATLQQTAQAIAATSEEITATTEELAATATELARDLEKLKQSSKLVAEHVDKTEEILSFVSEVAVSSNLLGLNAAIEAARAGDAGRGFAVVASEIRKMADNSARSVTEIKKIINAIKSETEVITLGIIESTAIGERQATASNEIASAMQQLASSATNVENIAQII